MHKPSLDAIRKALEAEIATGVLKPGDHLNEMALARQFSVSRTPIREVIRELAAVDLVEIKTGRGAFVTQLDEQGIWEYATVLAELEGACAKLAAKNSRKGDIDAIRASFEVCVRREKEGDTKRYALADLQFHKAICRAAHNTLLCEMAMAARTRFNQYIVRSFEGVKRLQISLAEHEAIMDAILGGRALEADKLLYEHIQNNHFIFL